MIRGQSTTTIYPVGNYSFGTKPAKIEKDTAVAQRMERLKEKYVKEGVRKSVDAVLLVYEHGHPHVLLLQVGTSFFKLPGGRLRPGEGESEGLFRKLTTSMAPEAENLKPDWQIGELLGTYYRPNFENILYPYCPPHISRPKEIRHIYLVNLPEKCYLSVPKNYRLVAVPLFEIYDHAQRYGPIISALPQLLSRFNLIMVDQDIQPSATPADVFDILDGSLLQQEQTQQQGGPEQKKRKIDQHEPSLGNTNADGIGMITISLQQPQAENAEALVNLENEFSVDFDM